MIQDFEGIKERVASFKLIGEPEGFATPEQAREAGVQCFLEALLAVVRELPSTVHLALSGGVDSTVLLYALCQEGKTVYAHTIVADLNHPDMQAAIRAVAQAPGTVYFVSHRVTPTDPPLDAYNYLLGAVKAHSDQVVCGDCIDEMLAGYYKHAQSGNKHQQVYDELLADLIPKHLVPLNAASQEHGIQVTLPYADARVMDVCAKYFQLQYLATPIGRKMPIYIVARLLGVPERIRERRKYGLVNWANPFPS